MRATGVAAGSRRRAWLCALVSCWAAMREPATVMWRGDFTSVERRYASDGGVFTRGGWKDCLTSLVLALRDPFPTGRWKSW